MKKLLLICFLISSLFASDIKIVKSIDELSEGKNIFLMFSTSYCPWCIRQTKVLENIQKKREDYQFVKVQDNTQFYKDLLKEYPFVVEFFPTSYIVRKEKGKLDIRYEFEGYQKEKNILSVIDDNDNF